MKHLLSLRLSIVLAGLILASLALGGCGIKPKQLSAPTEQGENPFPATYPSSAGE